LTALGIPAVYFAPGDIGICHTLEERVPVDEYLAGIAALAEFMARYCGT
jgi:acetylornithine deacetylase